ncbi:MAG: flavodoxin family protein [Alphaproteobacteria bacterium]|nr:flavodoxin family protein [Alphaproteobacteria bacterium]
MKVVAFNGSPRESGNTSILIGHVFSALEKEGIETELVQIGGKSLRGCTGCGACKKNQDKKCVLPDDGLNGYIEKMIEADGIIIGSPVYFSDVTAETKAFIDRAGYVCRANENLLKHKVGGAVAAARRAGFSHTLNSINHFLHIGQMYISGSCYWNLGIGKGIGDVENDDEGILTMKTLGENMAWLLKKIKQ